MVRGSAVHACGKRLTAAVTPTTWRYLAVAALVRIVDGGAAVSLVALVVSLHGRVSDADAGLLAALLTAPQLLGPLAAEPLARARDRRRVLALAFADFGVGLAACGLLLDHHELVLAAVAATAAGCAGPLVTGGLSTQSVARRADGLDAGLAGVRRAEALDAATYGVGSTVGPIAVAGVVMLLSPLIAVVALGTVALVAAGSALVLPEAAADSEPGRPQMPFRQVLAAIAGVGELRRVLAATTIAALGSGGLLVIAVVFGARLGGHASGGALLAGAFGVGSLAGSLALSVRPLHTEPERTTLALLAATGVCVALCALAPDQAAAAALFALTGAVASAQFTASLAVRSAYSPSGTRAHVYVTMAGLKMGCASAGAALAGVLLAVGPRPALLVIAGLITTGSILAGSMRRAASRHRQVRGGATAVVGSLGR
jgi:MFS family permease